MHKPQIYVYVFAIGFCMRFAIELIVPFIMKMKPYIIVYIIIMEVYEDL